MVFRCFLYLSFFVEKLSPGGEGQNLVENAVLRMKVYYLLHGKGSDRLLTMYSKARDGP